MFVILFALFASVAAEGFRFRFRGLDNTYAYMPQTILLLRESIACRADVSYENVLLESINGPGGLVVYSPDSSENTYKTPYGINCLALNHMHWDTEETVDKDLLGELSIEPIYEYQFFVPVTEVSRINYMNFLSGAVNEKYASILAADPHSFYDGQPYPVPNHQPVPAEEQHLFQLIVVILFVECALIAGLRYIINYVRNRNVRYTELSQIIVEPIRIFTPPKKRSFASAV